MKEGAGEVAKEEEESPKLGEPGSGASDSSKKRMREEFEALAATEVVQPPHPSKMRKVSVVSSAKSVQLTHNKATKPEAKKAPSQSQRSKTVAPVAKKTTSNAVVAPASSKSGRAKSKEVVAAPAKKGA